MITLSNIHEFTDQEVFDYITEQLLIQNKRSGTTTKCFYRSNDGSKCAVGLLMDEYRTSFDYCEETVGIDGYIVWTSMPLSRILNRFYPNAVPRQRLLVVLQAVHDYFNPKEWNHIFPLVRAALFEGKSLYTEGFLVRVIKEYHESI